MKDSIIFYLSHYEVVQELTNEQFGRLYRALFETAKGNDPKIDDDIKIPFGFIKNQMVLDIDKFNNKCLKNKENGKLGGRPKKDKSDTTTEETKKPKKANGFFENPNDNDNDNENDNENENENENDNDVSVYSIIEKNFGRTLNSIEYQEISLWPDNELTRYAIKQAVLNSKYTIKYISRIIDAYERDNIQTVQQAQERERKYNEAKKKRNKPESQMDKLEREIQELDELERKENEKARGT